MPNARPAAPRRPDPLALGLPALGLAVCVLAAAWPVAGVLASALTVLALAPAGRGLTRRVGVLLLAWLAASQFTYVLPWSDALPPRQAVGWALAATSVLVWHATRRDPRESLIAALPRLGPPDAALAAFTALTAWWYAPWSGGVDHVLTRLLMGWDHAGHFAMVQQLRAPTQAAASAFAGYPRGFHATVAGLIELGWGAHPGLDAEIVGYGTMTILVIAATSVLAAAWVFAAPVFGRHPGLLLLALGGLATLYLQVDDAAQAAYYGFAGWYSGVMFATVAVLLALTWTRATDRAHWLLYGLAVAGVVGTWTLLLAFCVGVPFAVWFARARHEAGALRRLLVTLPIGVLPPVAAYLAQPRAAAALTGEGGAAGGGLWAGIERFLLVGGAIRTSSLGTLAGFGVAGVVLPLVLLLIGRRLAAPARRVGHLVWATAPGALLTAAMLWFEYDRVGAPRYYGTKMLCSTTILAGTVGLVAAATLLGALLGRARSHAVETIAGLTAGILLACAAGAPVAWGRQPLSPGAATRAVLAGGWPDRRTGLTQAIRAACEAMQGRRAPYYLLTPGTNHEDAVRAGVWIISCGQNWDSPQSSDLRRLLPDTRGGGADIPLDLPRDAARILAFEPAAIVLVPASEADAVRAALLPAQAARVQAI